MPGGAPPGIRVTACRDAQQGYDPGDSPEGLQRRLRRPGAPALHGSGFPWQNDTFLKKKDAPGTDNAASSAIFCIKTRYLTLRGLDRGRHGKVYGVASDYCILSIKNSKKDNHRQFSLDISPLAQYTCNRDFEKTKIPFQNS